MSNRIPKPSRSKANATATATANPAVTPEMLAMAMAVFQAAGLKAPEVPATAETPKTVKPRYEKAVIGGLTIWISNPANGKSFAWLDKSIKIDDLRKMGDFQPAEYDKSSK